ncbi:hypothetical protein [Legionella tucsonensis]|uniref:Lipoprotein n=1 Tax=Legionella tucsonensis TaxID=40335 RepID=A0A0W0ZVU3_9GAMM|nr:hypothetical protein [Legionella tucsonensis]KTD73166.1 hypothetical protein Ltuc_1013 [Legionella tucsonensis]
MNRKNLFKSVLVLLFSFILSNCNKALPPGEYDSAEVGKVKKVIPGTVISKRPVNLRRNTSNITKNTSNSFEDHDYSQSHGVEYVIKLNSGGIISVVQAEDLKLKTKQKILVIYGRNTRVVADNGSETY